MQKETKTKTKNELISEGLKKYNSRKKTKKIVNKWLSVIIFLFLVPYLTITIHSKFALAYIDETLNSGSEIGYQRAGIEKYDSYGLGSMELAMRESSEIYNIPIETYVGIANAESTLGKNFFNPEDKNCHNWWGIRKVRITEKGNKSWLKCYRNEREGAMDFGRLMRNYYFDEGLDTPEEIVRKYVGNKWTQNHEGWINNVKKYWK